jgi:hypothetical protein
MDFATFLGAARSMAPDLVEWVTDDEVDALAACYAEPGDLTGSAKAVLDLDVPVLFWDGREDPNHAAFAAAHGFEFLSTAGNHIGAINDNANDVAAAVQSFITKPHGT